MPGLPGSTWASRLLRPPAPLVDRGYWVAHVAYVDHVYIVTMVYLVDIVNQVPGRLRPVAFPTVPHRDRGAKWALTRDYAGSRAQCPAQSVMPATTESNGSCRVPDTSHAGPGAGGSGEVSSGCTWSQRDRGPGQ